MRMAFRLLIRSFDRSYNGLPLTSLLACLSESETIRTHNCRAFCEEAVVACVEVEDDDDEDEEDDEGAAAG